MFGARVLSDKRAPYLLFLMSRLFRMWPDGAGAAMGKPLLAFLEDLARAHSRLNTKDRSHAFNARFESYVDAFHYRYNSQDLWKDTAELRRSVR